MKKNQPITRVMTTNPITVTEDESISSIRRLFYGHNIHHLPVVCGKDLKGIISWTDLMRLSFGDAFNQSDESVDVTLDYTFCIEDVMNPNPRTLSKKHTVCDAASILAESDFNSLPVVSGTELVGIVTTRDLVKLLATF